MFRAPDTRQVISGDLQSEVNPQKNAPKTLPASRGFMPRSRTIAGMQMEILVRST